MTQPVRALPSGTTTPRGLAEPDQIRWELVPARDLFDLVYGKALVASSRKAGDIPVYGTNGQCGWHNTPLFKGPGVVLGRKGQGPLGVEWVNGDYWVIDTGYALRPKTDAIDLRYSYFLIDFIGLNHLKDGTSNPTLSRDVFGSQALPVPPLAEQRAIAATLGALDDKIELNRKTNATLEAMARALFRDWFVDFGPTRAKAECRAPDLSPDLWSLFPDRLDAEGKPEGWAIGTLNDLASLNPESWTARNAPDRVAYVDLANTKWGNIDQVEYYAWADAPSRARRILRAGDTIVGTVRPGNGSFCYVGQDGLTGSTGFAVLRPQNPRDRAFVWCAATAAENIDRLAHLADGGAYPAVRPNAVAATEIIVPSEVVLAAFRDAVSANINLMVANKSESRTLAQTRDLLLPRLMSGELRVAEAEHIANEVA